MDVLGIDGSWRRPSGLKTASWRPTLLRSTAFRAIRRGKRCSGPRAEGRRPSRQPREAERGRRRTSGPNGSVVDLLLFRGTNPGRPSRVRITRPPGGGNGRPRRHGQNTTPGAPCRQNLARTPPGQATPVESLNPSFPRRDFLAPATRWVFSERAAMGPISRPGPQDGSTGVGFWLRLRWSFSKNRLPRRQNGR